MAKKNKSIVFILSSIMLLLGANFVLAADFGTDQVTNTINLAAADPRVIVGRIIQIALSFLGVVALVLIMYAGFTWMSSNGDEEKILRAKQILKNATIGLIIILSSWAITTFLLSRLIDSIGGGSSTIDATNNGSFVSSGMGAIGACSVVNFYPENGQTDVSRNSSIIITFKEQVNINTVCVNSAGQSCTCDNAGCNQINPTAIRIYKTDLGDACVSGSCPSTNTNITAASVSVSSDNKTLVISPAVYLGTPTDNIWYSVKITDDLKKKSDNSSMFKDCGTNYFAWKFEVGTRLDLTPPQVAYGSIFPLPDNQIDIQNSSAPAQAAQSAIMVNSCPNIYQAASVISVVPIGATAAATATPLTYNGNLTKFKVVVSAESKDKAQLFDGTDDKTLLGSADFDANGNAKFIGYFILTAPDRNSGSAWMITMSPEKIADTLTIGDQTYTFSPAKSGGNNIQTNASGCTAKAQANEIYAVLSGDPLVNVALNGNKISLMAKVAGASGNQTAISTTNQSALQIQAFQGGADRQDLSQVKDRKDTPMNTVIQINFSESVNPLKVSGLASEVANYIKIVNYEATSSPNGAPCSQNSDCRSYKCDGAGGNKVCVGDYVNGKFLVSNAYKTVEFISDNECGVNGCGEKIYCLPANSHLAVEMKSSDLKTCSTDNDCVPYAPFKTCSSTPLGYKTCQNTEGKNYPTSNNSLNGIIDASMNSFDGDRDLFSDGPITFYNDNYAATANLNKKDNYRWSFYVSDKIMLTPPKIESVAPIQGAMGINLADPIKITWSTLMMNSRLIAGSKMISNGSTTVEHKLINLKSSTPVAIGYWITNDNIDTAPLDGEPDKTISWINHTPFAESTSYRAQAGSGITDIYQNCFKPSSGAACSASDTQPSCCFGTPTGALEADGNCQ